MEYKLKQAVNLLKEVYKQRDPQLTCSSKEYDLLTQEIYLFLASLEPGTEENKYSSLGERPISYLEEKVNQIKEYLDHLNNNKK